MLMIYFFSFFFSHQHLLGIASAFFFFLASWS